MTKGIKAMRKEPSTCIALTRVPELCGFIMNMKVFLDQKEIGELPYATRKVFSVEPGSHELYVKMEMNYQRSRKISIEIPEGSTVELNCGSRFSGVRSIFNFILPVSLSIREGAVKLENVSDPEKRTFKLLLPFLLPTIMSPVYVFIIGVICLFLWLSEGHIQSLFGAHAGLFTLLFGLIGIGLIIVVCAIQLWKWVMKNL